MKTGRNDPCPCGSGIKFKKCCMDKDIASITQPNISDGKYFDLKGKNAEQIINIMAEKTFLKDWCFVRPSDSKGKEICDLLVIYDNTTIIFQIKSLKTKEGFYSKNKKEKIFKQLLGAKRKITNLDNKIQLNNERRKNVKISQRNLTHVFLIGIFYGEDEDFMEFGPDYKKHKIHVFSREFTNIILKELDTIRDFTTYLRKKELFLKKTSIVINGGEENLLGYYLFHNRRFKDFSKANIAILDDGIWKDISNKEEYKRKKQNDKNSYLWDYLIEKVYEGKDAGYEIISREMAKLNRFERRVISDSFIEAHFIASRYKPQTQFKRVGIVGKTTYCFLFQKDDLPRKLRKNTLVNMCFIAKRKFPQNSTIIGIATESDIKPIDSYDFCYIKKNKLSKEDIERIDKMQSETKILTNTFPTMIHDDEYRK